MRDPIPPVPERKRIPWVALFIILWLLCCVAWMAFIGGPAEEVR